MSARTSEAAEFVRTALSALARYKLRTFLSVLGMVLGVAGVIAMMSVGEGARRQALAQVQALGLDNLVARTRIPSAGRITASGLTVSDADALVNLVPGTHAVSPLLERYLRAAGDEGAVMSRVLGIRPAFSGILRLHLVEGRFLSLLDDRDGTAVCVLGSTLAARLFGPGKRVGKGVSLGGRYFGVVGVLADHGADPDAPSALAWRNLNDAALVPIAALSGRTLAMTPGQPVDEIWLQVRDGEQVEEAGGVMSRGLAARHQGRLDFDVIVPRELLAQRQRTQQTFSVVVGGIAGLALLVGGIGIMNIMLTSVVERTHEIGIRRAVGATRGGIMRQFLVEAVLMTVGGGVAGIFVGTAVSSTITWYAGWSTRLSPDAIAISFGVSVAIGMVFGLYPAITASRLVPIDALRHE